MSGIVSIARVKNRGRLGSGRVKRLPDPCLPRFSLLRYCRAIFAIAIFCSLTSRTGCWRANRLVFFPLNFSHQTNLWIDSTNFRGDYFSAVQFSFSK